MIEHIRSDMEKMATQFRDDLESLAQQSHNNMGKLRRQPHKNFTAASQTAVKEMTNDNNTHSSKVKAHVEANTTTEETLHPRINALENNSNTSTKTDHKADDQRSARTVATGIIDVSTDGEVKEFLKSEVTELRIEESPNEIYCPAKPITHAFLQSKRARDRHGFLRMTSRQQNMKDDRCIIFKSDLKPGQRYLQKQLGYAKYCLNEKCKMPPFRIQINIERKTNIDPRRTHHHHTLSVWPLVYEP